MATSKAAPTSNSLPRSLANGHPRLPKVEAEITALLALDRVGLHTRLRQAMNARDLNNETLVYFARTTCQADRETFLLATEALYIAIKPTLLAHARPLHWEEWENHVQDVMLAVSRHLADQNPTLDYAEQRFSSYLKRRTVDALRARDLERRVHTDPIDTVAESEEHVVGNEREQATRDQMIDLQAGWKKLDRLRREVRKAFIHRVVLGLSVAETIARAPGHPDASTINNWVNSVKNALKEPDGEQS